METTRVPKPGDRVRHKSDPKAVFTVSCIQDGSVKLEDWDDFFDLASFWDFFDFVIADDDNLDLEAVLEKSWALKEVDDAIESVLASYSSTGDRSSAYSSRAYRALSSRKAELQSEMVHLG